MVNFCQCQRCLNGELTDTLLEYWKLKSDGELARELGIDNRVKVQQYRNRKGTEDIQYRIIVNLLRDIGYLERKLEEAKKSPS